MASEPADATLRMLRDIRVAQEKHGNVLETQSGSLARLEKRVEDLYKISTHTLGVAVTAHERYEALEARVEKLAERVDRLETKQ
jgi:polyhydroxyalkanoate synthesis regulator phasin